METTISLIAILFASVAIGIHARENGTLVLGRIMFYGSFIALVVRMFI